MEFSVSELKKAYENSLQLFNSDITTDDVEDALFFLSRIEAIKIEGGFLVVYNGLTVERIERDNKKRYKTEDYQKLQQYYENKIQQIHIVGEYAKMMITDYRNALTFVDDYFKLNYTTFLNKYFKGSRQNEIKRNITPAKFQQLFGGLSPVQLKIINDKEAKYIVVAAGPGSGKTKLLVHKLASLLLMEDVKHEQLLMLTFSRAAATEFKKRLVELIGTAAYYIEMKTFHSYCFDLLGKVGTLEKSDQILKNTVEKIKNKEVEPSRITKTVLVIDEAQDIQIDEFNLINALIEANDDMRVIAVGDDDQNIYEFRGSNSKYLSQLAQMDNHAMYELVENYRSRPNLVAFANQFVQTIPNRLKHTPIIPVQQIDGTIKLVRHQSNHLITPLVENILLTPPAGTTCILTKTNDEALQVCCLLLKNGISSKVIQSNEGFKLEHLLEIRFFLDQLNLGEDVYLIHNDLWRHAKETLCNQFRNSTKLEMVMHIINEFEAVNPVKKYKSDLEAFIHESNLEDFLNKNTGTIFVSTIHKAKGKEFDNIYLLLENLNIEKDEVKRQVYVAITRAKERLIIHVNASYLDRMLTRNLEKTVDHRTYLPPNNLAIYLGLKDVWLDYFINKQQLISQLISGSELIVNGDECLNHHKQPVLRFSKSTQVQIQAMKDRNYYLKSAKVNFIVYWLKDGAEHAVKVILPELYFEKIN